MTARRILLTLSLIALIGAPASAASNVLVVVNQRSRDSMEIGSYYAKKRSIPAKNICRISVVPNEVVSMDDYENRIRDAVRDYLDRNHLKGKIDYIVTTRGVPLTASGRGDTFSVDSSLTCIYSLYIGAQWRNPYFGAKDHFSFKKYGFLMVTRLDGYTKADAMRLVDLSLRAKPAKGPFVLDVDPTRDGHSGYGEFNGMMRTAASTLKKRGYKVLLDTSRQMAPPQKNLMGYYTWGSNDHGWDFKRYIGNTYTPGAIAETLVSTSARSFSHVRGGQSLISDLIARGVTGVKGYCAEPYSNALAHADILFDRYTRGFNLAESFYASSVFIHWRDVVIGDPLCAPYAGRGK